MDASAAPATAFFATTAVAVASACWWRRKAGIATTSDALTSKPTPLVGALEPVAARVVCDSTKVPCDSSPPPLVVRAGVYSSEQTILILGDGDFTFSAGLVSTLRKGVEDHFPRQAYDSDAAWKEAVDSAWCDVARMVISTSYDSLDDLHTRYPSVVTGTLQTLHDAGVRVFHGVDATNLQGTLPWLNDASMAAQFPPKFDRVVFNFPHHAGKGLIHVNRALLAGSLRSASHFIKPACQGGELHIALAPGQGGTPLDEPRTFGNHWQIVNVSEPCASLPTVH